MLKEIIVVFALTTAFVIGAIFSAIKLSHRFCHMQAEAVTAVDDYQYTLWTGCLWKVDGEWWPADRYREIE